MVSLKRGLLAAAIASALLMYSDSSPKYYDSPGGLNERYMNQHFSERFDDSKSLEYLANTDRIEKKHYFEELGALEGANERIFTLMAENDNDAIIRKVDAAKRESLNARELRLKDLLDDLDRIARGTPDKGKLLGLLHDRINQSISIGEPLLPYVNILGILNHQNGDCNNVSAAHSSLYAHYGFETRVRFGRAKAIGTDKTALHAWLEVKAPDMSIELDPTWYRTFAPLEARHE